MYKVIQTGLARLQVTINNKSSVVYVCVLSFFLFLFARDYNIWEEKIHHQAIMFTLHQDEQQFLFESQTKFSASLDWPFSQQQALMQQPKANTDIWLKQPPDFSDRLYRSSNPSQKPQGKGKRELKPKPTSESIVMQQLSRLRSRLLLPLSEKKRDLPQFVTHFPWISSYEAKTLFVKNGKYDRCVWRAQTAWL